jgi:hypothetical protein
MMPVRRARGPLAAAATFSCIALAPCRLTAQDEPEIPDLVHFVGSDEAKKLLLEQGFVVVPAELREIFQPYCGLPMLRQAGPVRHERLALVRVLDPRRGERAPARARAGARAGGLLRRLHERLAELGERELLEVVAGARSLLAGAPDAPARVAFLATPPVPADGLVPSGAYAGSPVLAGYWRARGWLSLTVFSDNVPREKELAARLRDATLSDTRLADLHARLVAPHRRLLGEAVVSDQAEYQRAAQALDRGPGATRADDEPAGSGTSPAERPGT